MPSRVRQASSAHLTPGGHVRDVLELGGFVQVFQVLLGELLAADHGEEELCQVASFLDGLAR